MLTQRYLSEAPAMGLSAMKGSMLGFPAAKSAAYDLVSHIINSLKQDVPLRANLKAAELGAL